MGSWSPCSCLTAVRRPFTWCRRADDPVKQTQALFSGFIQLGAGLSVGLAGLAAGFAIGIVGDAGVRGTAQQPKLFVAMILILIFAEVLGLYGLIVALLLNTKAAEATCS